MHAHSPRDRSRSPHNSNGTSSTKQLHHSNSDDTTSNQTESTGNSKSKKETETQQRLKNLKTFIQTLINDSSSIGTTYDEQVKVLESACIEEYRDLSHDRIRRMIRSVLKVRKSHPSTTSSSFLQQEHTNITNDRFNSNGNNKKNRTNSIPNTPTTKTSDLIPSSPTSTLSAFDADFLRHAFSQQFRPSLDLSAYFSAATNGNNSASSLFRPNFSPSNFLQALTSTTPLAPPPPTLISSHTNGITDSSTTKSSKQAKLSNTETNSIKVLVNAYREAASYLSRSADELEQLI